MKKNLVLHVCTFFICVLGLSYTAGSYALVRYDSSSGYYDSQGVWHPSYYEEEYRSDRGSRAAAGALGGAAVGTAIGGAAGGAEGAAIGFGVGAATGAGIGAATGDDEVRYRRRYYDRPAYRTQPVYAAPIVAQPVVGYESTAIEIED